MPDFVGAVGQRLKILGEMIVGVGENKDAPRSGVIPASS